MTAVLIAGLACGIAATALAVYEVAKWRRYWRGKTRRPGFVTDLWRNR